MSPDNVASGERFLSANRLLSNATPLKAVRFPRCKRISKPRHFNSLYQPQKFYATRSQKSKSLSSDFPAFALDQIDKSEIHSIVDELAQDKRWETCVSPKDSAAKGDAAATCKHMRNRQRHQFPALPDTKSQWSKCRQQQPALLASSPWMLSCKALPPRHSHCPWFLTAPT